MTRFHLEPPAPVADAVAGYEAAGAQTCVAEAARPGSGREGVLAVRS